MKKNILKIVALVAIIATVVCCFTACTSKISGKYVAEDFAEQSFTFKEDNIVAMSAFGLSVEGEYVIEDDEITITYSLGPLSYDWTKSFEKDGKTIIIDGRKFTKEK